MTKQVSVRRRRRRRTVEWHLANGRSVSVTCRRVGLSRPTLYRWLDIYDPSDPVSLKPLSRRPHRTRQPTWSERHLLAVAELSRRHPAFGKRRLHRILAGDGEDLSEAAVGRLLAIVRAGCPRCGGKDGRHVDAQHAVRRDVAALRLDRLLAPKGKPRRRASASALANDQRRAVREANRIAKGGGVS
jgi:transposase